MTTKKIYQNYLNKLVRKLSPTLLFVIATGIFYITIMSFLDHSIYPFTYIILLLSIMKTVAIANVTLKKVSKLMDECKSFKNMILTFGLLILITLFSFATDYNCLFQSDSESFNGIVHFSGLYLNNLYQFFYFSVTTFSTVGFGDINLVSDIAKFIVMLEIFLSFLIIVFSLAYIKKVPIND